jgi:homoserine dehydrogenase
MKALIVGNGNVGKAFARLSSAMGWRHVFFPRRIADGTFIEYAKDVDIVIIAISTKDKGEIELGFILRSIETGKPVVTAAKGASAYHWPALEPHQNKIGLTATVGGASGMRSLFHFIHHPIDPIEEISGIVNGTINHHAWAVQNGMSHEVALQEEQRLGLCEPGQFNLASVINAEEQDALKKAAILFNWSDVGEIVTPDDFSYSILSESEIRRQLSKPGNRFVITISKRDKYRFGLEGFGLYAKPWLVQGTFMEGAASRFQGIRTDRQNNALTIRTKMAGSVTIGGIGAGPIPTAAVMLEDARHLLGIN